jgi:transcriptional regulator with XRE-family HTH domain
MQKNPNIGTSLDTLLQRDGTRDEVHDLAQKRVIAWQLEQAAKDAGVAKAELARRMGTSRAQVDRILDPVNNKVQLDTLQRAARALGRRLEMVLV